MGSNSDKKEFDSDRKEFNSDKEFNSKKEFDSKKEFNSKKEFDSKKKDFNSKKFNSNYKSNRSRNNINTIQDLKNSIELKENKINDLKELLEIKDEEKQEVEYELSLKDQELNDLQSKLDILTVENEELTIELNEKESKISKLNNALVKCKYEKDKVDLVLKNEVNIEKSRLKEMDNLNNTIKEKIAIIHDKQEQINYLRTLIDDYKDQTKNNTDNLDLQLKKITKTYEGLLNQKDSIIEKQEQNINELIESQKQIAKDNKATITRLELEIGKYREELKKS